MPAYQFSRTSIAIFSLVVAAAGWQIALAFLHRSADARTALIWAKAGSAFIPLLAAGAYQCVASILPAAPYRRVISLAAWVVAAQIALFTLTTGYLVGGVRQTGSGFYPQYHLLARVVYPLLFGIMFAAAVGELIRAYPRAAGIERVRIRFFTIAFGLFCLSAVDLAPAYGLAVYPIGWLALAACAGVVVYTVTRHGTVPITPSLAATEIISTMRDLLLVSDREGRIRFVNNAACAFLGYGREDLIGRKLEEVLAPAAGADVTPLRGWVRDREYVFRTKMGQPIELTLSHSPVTHRGEVTGAVIIGRDLRERKRYEWEARRAVTLLQSTLDSTADGILAMGEDGRIFTWNQRFADMWGIAAEVMEDDVDRHLMALLVAQLVDPTGFLSAEQKSVNVLELEDGRRFEQYSIGRSLDDLPLRVWSFRDVTARLAAEEALRDSETRYRLLFEQNAAGVCLATASGRIVDCNATFAEMVGYGPAELRDRTLLHVFERAAALDEIQHRLDETPTVRGVEIEMRRPDGERVSALANVSRLGTGERALVHLTAVDISDRKRAEERIEFQAYHDALTQLPNRRLFVERLELSLLAARRARENVGVLFIDLDRFKTINDTLGHSVADAVLVEIAQRLKSCVRQTDTVARHGGDEFTVILPDLHQPEDAAQVAEKILERVVEPVVSGSTAIQASVSIGIAVFPYDGTDIDTLLRNADDAMYRAKQAGRNTYQLCTEQMKTRALERSSMHSRLRRAMTDEELVLAYEPVVSLKTGQVTGSEAMVHWNDPERGIIESSDFIPIAEETRLVVPLGEWTLMMACRQVARWRDAGMQPVRMAVNISARQFQQRDLAVVVRRAIDECGIDPASVELEIRETTALRDIGLTIELLHLLRDAGVSTAIDDFGSAHSSLGSLRLLPINAVKLDRRLIENVVTAPADAAIVDAVIAVSNTLGLRVSAEGVETREQFELLKSHGCHEAQGSYFSRALDPAAFQVRASPFPAI